MKKINHSSSIFLALIIVAFAAFYGCQKNPVDNFKIIVSPALFEYTASIRIIDAADSTVPPNLKIVLNPENEGYLYDILGKNKLAISDNGYIQVGLKPSIKPGADNPVEIRFQLQADNYISENYSLVYHLGQYTINKTYTLMNKSNLPRGVSYTQVTAAITKGVLDKDLNINLGGGQDGNSLKSASENVYNKINLKAGTKFYYWAYDKNLTGWNKWFKTEVIETGEIKGEAYFRQGYNDFTCNYRFEVGYIYENGVAKAIPANSAMFGMGGWEFCFRINDKWVFPELDDEPSATLQLSLPKSGINLKTRNLYQSGDLINIYQYKWNYDIANDYSYPTFDLVASETLSESSDFDPDYFKLKSFKVNGLNNIMIGEISPAVKFTKNPLVKLQGDNNPPSWGYGYIQVSQKIYRKYKYHNQYLNYYVGNWLSCINEPEYETDSKIYMPGTYEKFTEWTASYYDKENDKTFFKYNYFYSDKIEIGQGRPNPFDLTILSNQMQLTTINFSVKCGNTIIKPSFYFQVGGYDDDNRYTVRSGGYIIDGIGGCYIFAIGGTYDIIIYLGGKTIKEKCTITSSNIEILIDDDSFCTF